jgi:HD-GYP domain-containing protein (c-di-GMP phosphodiesterase class II)
MFDILRNKDEDKNEKKVQPTKEGTKEPAVNFPREILKTDTRPNKEPEDHSLVSKKLIAEVKKHGVDNQEKAKEIYDSAVQAVKALLEKARIEEDITPYMEKISNLLDDIFNQLVLGDSILDNIYEQKNTEDNLAYHIVNTLLLSSVIGLNMGFNKSRLQHLGLAAIFCDIGVENLREIEEGQTVKNHIAKSLKLADRIEAIDEAVKEAIRMHHERVNGKGYPEGITAEQISPYAKIIGLVDTYEVMINKPSAGEGMNAHQALIFIIGSLKDYFDPDLMKVFINKMSIYPIGSTVRLDTQELARVISVQPGSPLRPVVMIISDPLGEPVKERVIIDLSQQDFPAIQGSL